MLNDILQEILPVIQSAAPAIASALGLNSIAANTPWALYLLGKAFGVDLNNVKELPQKIAEDPDHETKLCDLDDYFSEWFMHSSKNLTKDVRISQAELNLKVTFGSATGSPINT